MERNRNSTRKSRVRQHTSHGVISEIDGQIAESVRLYADKPEIAIRRRIDELDMEWDIERKLEATASAIVVGSCALGFGVSKKWFWLTALVGGFLLQHALQGWCPPLPVFRQLGARTRKEIDREKFALKALRGDFKGLPSRSARRGDPAARAVKAVTS